MVKEKLLSVKAKALAAVPAAAVAISAAAPLVAYAAEGDTSASASATEAVGVVTAIASLFTTYPMNIFLAFGIAAGGIGLFATAKKAAGGRKG